MATIDDIRARRLARSQAGATATLPELPELSPGARTESPAPVSIPSAFYEPPATQRFGRALQFLRMTLEPLERATSTFRVGILTASGKYSPEQFSKRAELAWSGKLRISAREFNTLMLGESLYRTLEETNLVPGWTRAMIAPEWELSRSTTRRRPVISAATIANFAADVIADPFALLSFTPAGATRAVARATVGRIPRVGMAAAEIVANPYRIVTRPLAHLVGLEGRTFSPLGLALEPRDMLSGRARPIYEDTVVAYHQTREAIHETSLAFKQALEAQNVDHVIRDVDSRRALGAWLSELDLGPAARNAPAVRRQGGLRALTPDERKVAGIMAQTVRGELTTLAARGDTLAKRALAKGGTLGDLYPRFVGLSKGSTPFDILQSFDWEKIGRINFFERRSLDKIDWHWENLDGLETFKSFLYVSKRKQHLEPTLLKYAPRRHAAGATPAERMAAGESDITAHLTPTQYRYVTSWYNEFTGHGRGRTYLMFDAATARFWDNIYNNPRLAPMTQRIERVMQLSGSKPNLDGLLDFSPTARITGALTHNIFRNAVGLNLSSSLLNLSQLSNTAVWEGIPATLRGMLRMGSREFRSARANTDLLRDYRSIFDDVAWGRSFRQGADSALFLGFNTAERIIRGVAFNVGLDRWMRSNGFKALSAVERAGKLSDAYRAAHFASIESSFLYGVLGTSPRLMNPLLGPVRSLVTYGPKQAAFLHRTFSRDGGAFLRFLGLHGWLIERANEDLGVAGETTFGWGFFPKTKSFGGIPFIESPPIRVLHESLLGLEAIALNRDPREASSHWQKLIGDRDAVLRTVAGTGLLPVPIIEPMNWMQLRERLRDKRQRIGEGYVPISAQEATAAFVFGQSTNQRQRIDLAARQRRASAQVDHELDKRTRSFIKALGGTSADDISDSAMLMAAPVWIEGERFWPEEEQYNTRLERLMLQQRVSKDVISLTELGAFEQLFLPAALEQLNRTYGRR